MGRKSSQQVNAEVNRLRRILENPENSEKSDLDIMLELEIKKTTYYRYKETIREQDREAWLEIAKESLESAALKVKKSLDFCTKVSKDVANNSQDARARIEAAKKVVECQIMAYKMLKEGPTSKSITVPKVIEDGTDRGLESTRRDSIAT